MATHTVGRHGEYLLPLTADFEPEMIDHPPFFDLTLEEIEETDSDHDIIDFKTYQQEEHVLLCREATPDSPGERAILNKHWKMLENTVITQYNVLNAYVTQELHDEPQPRVIWEVYAGASRMSQMAESFGASVETFSYETGWDFDDPQHRRVFLQRLQDEAPDELFLAPRCGLWSRLQSINARTEEQRGHLQDQRQVHHDTHLQFCRKAYNLQAVNGRHAHLEQPDGALSWKTCAWQKHPGYYVTFDQCRFGACCLDDDGVWKLVKKPTGLKTTKQAVEQQMNLRCDHGHDHCRLEGRMPGMSRSHTSYMEDYQPAMASVLAVALLAPQKP